eukprot:scaffold17265_cov101-Isochrysis_galbana.AAC.2
MNRSWMVALSSRGSAAAWHLRHRRCLGRPDGREWHLHTQHLGARRRGDLGGSTKLEERALLGGGPGIEHRPQRLAQRCARQQLVVLHHPKHLADREVSVRGSAAAHRRRQLSRREPERSEHGRRQHGREAGAELCELPAGVAAADDPLDGHRDVFLLRSASSAYSFGPILETAWSDADACGSNAASEASDGRAAAEARSDSKRRLGSVTFSGERLHTACARSQPQLGSNQCCRAPRLYGKTGGGAPGGPGGGTNLGCPPSPLAGKDAGECGARWPCSICSPTSTKNSLRGPCPSPCSTPPPVERNCGKSLTLPEPSPRGDPAPTRCADASHCARVSHSADGRSHSSRSLMSAMAHTSAYNSVALPAASTAAHSAGRASPNARSATRHASNLRPNDRSSSTATVLHRARDSSDSSRQAERFSHADSGVMAADTEWPRPRRASHEAESMARSAAQASAFSQRAAPAVPEQSRSSDTSAAGVRLSHDGRAPAEPSCASASSSSGAHSASRQACTALSACISSLPSSRAGHTAASYLAAAKCDRTAAAELLAACIALEVPWPPPPPIVAAATLLVRLSGTGVVPEVPGRGLFDGSTDLDEVHPIGADRYLARLSS